MTEAINFENKAPEVLGVIISMLVLGGIFIGARTITRTIIRPIFGWDDALIIFTWFIILGYAIAMSVSVSRGYGKHIEAIVYTYGEDQYSKVVHAEIIGQVFAIASFPTGKASIAVLICRLFPGKVLRWVVWILVLLNTIWFYADAILIVIQCQPAAYQWNRKIPGGKCWDPKIVTNWGTSTGVIGAITDFAYALIPWYYVSKLQMATREKIVIGTALSCGLFAGIASVLKIYYTQRLTARSDYAFDTIPLVEWSCVELAFINVAACIPTLRPLYEYFSGKKRGGTTNKSYGGGSSAFSRLGEGVSQPSNVHSRPPADSRDIYEFKTFGLSYDARTAADGQPKTGNAQGTNSLDELITVER